MNGYSPLIKDTKRLQSQLFFFVIWPFGAFLSSLRNIKSRNFLVMYVLFCILLCWDMDVNKNASYDDLSGTASIFLLVDHSTTAFLKRLIDYVTFAPDAPREIYTYIMMWLSHLLSDNPHFFFAFSSLPFLYFQVKCFRMILEDGRFVSCAMGVLIMFLFMFPRDIVTVQNPRFSVALWICIYFIMKSFHPLTQNNRHLLWLLATPMIHSSYWFLAPIILFGILLAKSGKGESVLVALVYVSIPFSYMSGEIGQQFNIASFLPLPEGLSYWMTGHLQGEKEAVSWGTSGFYWVPVLFSFLKTTVYLMVPLAIIRKREVLNKDPKTQNLFLFYLFLYAFVNFVQVLPVISDRAIWFIQILSIYMIFRVYGMNSKMYQIILIGCLWSIFSRYYGGVFERSVPYILFYTPLPYLLYHYGGTTTMDVQILDGINIESYL